MAALKNGHIPQVLATEYASYRDDVISVLASELAAAQQTLSRPLVLYDPMAGTAPLLPLAERQGFTAYFNDLNSLHLYVNAAKTSASYVTFRATGRAELVSFFRRIARNLDRCLPKPTDGWIEIDVLKRLKNAWEKGDQEHEPIRTLIRAVLLIAVRHFSSFIRTENPTWLKPGGLRPSVSAWEVFLSAIDRLDDFYSAVYENDVRIKSGSIFLADHDASQWVPDRQIDVVITSPPFCNRVDWNRLYAPEHFFLNAVDVWHTRTEFLGTTAVDAYPEFEFDLEFVTKRSEYLDQLLRKIKKRQIRGERRSDYYLKYFTRYFAGLLRIVDMTVGVLGQENAGAYFVVQDNVHRGMLIEIGKALSESLITLDFRTSPLLPPWERHHLGLRNISKKYRLVSPKQREWIWHAVQ